MTTPKSRWRHLEFAFAFLHVPLFNGPASMSEFAAQTAAIIPCLNESQAIAPVVIAGNRQVGTVIVVDDGSTDSTAVLAEQAGAIVVRHPRNEGKGAALANGFRRALELGKNWGICLDGDGQHDPEE